MGCIGEYTATGVPASAGSAVTKQISELEGGGCGRVDIFVFFGSASNLPPGNQQIGIQIFFAGFVVASAVGVDSNGNISAVRTFIISNDGKTFTPTGGGNPITVSTGFFSAGVRVEVNWPDVVGEIYLQTSETAPDDIGPPGPNPTPPNNLGGSEVDDHVQVTWTDNATDEDGFFIERSEDGGAFELVATTPQNVTSWDDYGANPDLHAYQYRISAFKSTAVSTASNTFSIGTVCGDKTLPWTLMITPTTGTFNGGTIVTIDGVVTNVNNPATGQPYILKVNIGGTWVTPTTVDTDTITFVTPAHVIGAVSVGVFRTETGEEKTVTNGFTYVDNRPSIVSLDTPAGYMAGGTTVRIFGSGFVSGSQVLFGSTPATSSIFISSTEYQAVTPPHAAGTVDVYVIGP